MTHEVEINGRVRRVTVARAGEAFTVTIDGRAFAVGVARVDAQTVSLLVEAAGEAPRTARAYDVSVARDPASARLAVRVGEATLLVALNGRRRPAARDEGQAGTGPQRLVAPMPGKVTRVLVHAGEAVRARQPLVVVEAMKMENELRAARDGTVADIAAHEGQLVEAGALLVIIAPAAPREDSESSSAAARASGGGAPRA